jgi:hypothetical protein
MMELLKQIMITEVLDGLQEFSNHLVMRDGFSEELKEVTYAVGPNIYIKIPLQCVWVTFTKVL